MAELSERAREHTHTGQQETKKLRVLCLHGFRQTAGSFFGRTHAFRKALKVKNWVISV